MDWLDIEQSESINNSNNNNASSSNNNNNNQDDMMNYGNSMGLPVPAVNNRLMDWRSRDTSANYATLPDPNDKESVPTVIVAF